MVLTWFWLMVLEMLDALEKGRPLNRGDIKMIGSSEEERIPEEEMTTEEGTMDDELEL